MASGDKSTVPGGFHNTASGTSSLAAGNYATADTDLCFVFSGWSSEPSPHLSCSGVVSFMRVGFNHGLEVDYFAPNASGGGQRYVYIGDVIGGKTIVTWTNAYLSDAGVWTNNSDLNQKTGFKPINAAQVLAQVARMPITSWRYRNEDTNKRHIGPMAQDFWTAFGLGDDDKHIGTIDESGVALAAIQGLHQAMRQQMRAKDKEIAQLKDELRAIKAKLGM